MIRIINLVGNDFENKAVELKDKILKEYTPDIVISIATGGTIVVDAMKLTGVNFIDVKCQRKSTKTKNKLNVGFLLRMLPQGVNNALRRIELAVNEKRFIYSGVNHGARKIIVLSGSFCNLNSDSKVLLVDDAVDSGETLLECIAYIKKHLGNNVQIKTAVINTTFKSPAITPDYQLYTRTIVRYPWANDTHGN